MTNDGDLMDGILRARNFHEKEYIVTVNRKIDENFIKQMRQGVYLKGLDVTTRPCKVKKIGADTFSIILTQGLNRQIRRMCEYFGYRVEALKRVRIMNIELGDLKPGQYRPVTKEEYQKLLSMTKNSYSAPKQNQKAGGKKHE